MAEPNELNKKLAEWGGIDIEVGAKERYLDSVSEGKGKGYLGNETWESDCEEWRKRMFRNAETPNFTESLDACFKWLVPEVVELLNRERNWDEKGAVHHIFRSWLREFWKGKGSLSYALALCLAIEKLIDGESNARK